MQPLLHAFSKDDLFVVQLFETYWSNMAKYGTPNGDLGSNIAWPTLNATLDLYMNIRSPNNVGVHLGAGDPCDFWATRYPKFQFDP